jgi:putative tryptophan/tyrosine transport system substrate-binding protein
MRRRELVLAAGGLALAWPLAGGASPPGKPVMGFLCSASASEFAYLVAAFRAGLSETGYVEGESVAIEYRWADDRYDRLPALAADLVRRRVAIIVATGGSVSALAAKAATATIPIVFTTGIDPVKAGLVTSISRPGGNMTGVTLLTTVLIAKQLDLLRTLIPSGAAMAVLVNPNNRQGIEQNLTIAAKSAHTAGQQILVVSAGDASEIDAAFASLARQGAKGLLVPGEPLYIAARDEIVGLAARHAIPTIYSERVFVASGGLIGYGASLTELFRQAGVYAGRILLGAKPADLPVLQPLRFELVINLKTAKALGLAVPPALLAVADEVIE